MPTLTHDVEALDPSIAEDERYRKGHETH